MAEADLQAPIPRGQFSDVFEKLVEDGTDLVGMVAYCVYKRQKVEWITAFRAKHGGVAPSDGHLADEFGSFCSMPTQLQHYRAQAVQLIDSFLEVALEQKTLQMEAAIRDEGRRLVANKSFWKGVAESVVAGLVTLLLTAGVTGIAWVIVTGPGRLTRRLLENLLGVG